MGEGTVFTGICLFTPGGGEGTYPGKVQTGGGAYLGQGRYPPSPARTDQHSEHLLRGGRYASCVHAGGLSCLSFAFTQEDFLVYLCPSLNHIPGAPRSDMFEEELAAPLVTTCTYIVLSLYLWEKTAYNGSRLERTNRCKEIYSL